VVLRDPRFPVSDWSCWEATKEGRPRTNNHNEGRNRANKRQFYRGAPPKLSFSLRIDRKEEHRIYNVYQM
jgi:hypothetical protein